MGVAEKIDPGASWRKILGPPGMWTEFARDGQVAGARAAAVAVGMWKSRAFVFGAISKRGGKRGKVRGTGFSPRQVAGRTFPRFPRRVISTATSQSSLPGGEA